MFAQCILEDFCSGVQGHSLVRVEHEGKNERIAGQRGLSGVECGICDGHAASLQRQIVVRIILPQVLVLQAHNRLILFIRVDVQLDQARPRFNDQRQDAVRNLIRY